jgi:hypothetical protein
MLLNKIIYRPGQARPPGLRTHPIGTPRPTGFRACHLLARNTAAPYLLPQPMRRKCRPACEKTPVPEKARLYLLAPAADGLVPRPERSFWWGYGYYGIFAALAALGAAFEGVAEQPSREWPSSHPIVAPPGWSRRHLVLHPRLAV